MLLHCLQLSIFFSEIYSGDLQLDASHSLAEEISDNGSEEYLDPDDYTWEPSLTSIRLLEDSNLEYIIFLFSFSAIIILIFS